MADLSGIRAAIAAKCLVTGIKSSTSTKLDGAVEAPCIKVLDVDIKVTGRPNANREERTLTVRGVLLVAKPTVVGPALITMESEAELLFAACRLGVKLGFPTVVHDSWLDEFHPGRIPYGGQDYTGAELIWIVETKETIPTRTA